MSMSFVPRVRVVMDHAKIAAIVEGMPRAAHMEAAQMAGNAAAARVGTGRTGALSADLRNVGGASQLRGAGGRFASGFGSTIGSGLPYARIEHFGGVISARNPDAYGRYLLYIRPGEIVAAVSSVPHAGKRWGDVAGAVYLSAMMPLLKANFPG
jgi:hypothetical protein